ncbi:secretion protein HlyD [Novosphingopyxis sp.]|uniref:secretion protein HlyD n=1 Tax=Novosphingopyxis sp. TaxID=2709690 RepID=UPI003B5A3214
MSRNRRISIGVLAVIGLAALVWFFLLRPPSDEPLKLYGNIDIREVDLAFRVDGRVAELLVDEGDAVRAGQLLGRLDPEPLRAELSEAEANIGAQNAQLDLLRAGSRVEDIAQAQALVDERRASLANASADVARLSQLRQSGATSTRSYEDASNARDEAAARLRNAQQGLKESRAGSRRQEVERAAANVGQAKAAADRVKLRLSDTELFAPSSGILLTRAIEKGAIVSAGSTVFTEALANPVWARVYVDQPNLGLVAPGARVTLTTDAAPGKVYHGKVGYVSPTAEFTPKTVETPELRTDLVYRARIVVLDPDTRLRQGMPVTVQLASGAIAVKEH